MNRSIDGTAHIEPSPIGWESWGAAEWPLGAHPTTDGLTTFAVHAPAATRVLLELYPSATASAAAAEFDMARGEDGRWRAKLAGVGHGTLYGFRCWGPNWPHDPSWQRGNSAAGFGCDVDEDGNRFNPNKVLFDPYAREITHNVLAEQVSAAGADPGVFGTGGEDCLGAPRRELDTGPWAPKGIVIHDDTSTGRRPLLPAEKAAIHEAHVKNMTLHPSATRLRPLLGHLPGFERVADVPVEAQGTYLGVAAMAPYFKACGITTLELMPVQETNTSERAQHERTANHWGYQTLAYFAPNRGYARDKSPGGPTREFKQMVATLHDHGLEIYLDVVFNHTAEGGHWDGDNDTTGFVSLGGFAVNDYYVQTEDHHLVDGATGCSNQVNASTPASQRLVLDSLRYWAEQMGIDGFRFDLAPVLGRAPNEADRQNWAEQRQFFPTHPLLTEIANLGEELQLEVIAEAWDLWGYEVGNFPAGWGEWNGRYRDALRRYLKGDGNTDAFISMVNGDYEAFNDQGGAQRSINFVTAHDGFTMMDLVSYNAKNNDQPYPFGPSDGGTDDNLSWDSGGDQALRRCRVRNFWAMLFLSRGVPMVVSGDEFGRTQNGNNNPWALNTIGMWNNWEMPASNAPTRVPVDPDNPAYAYHDVFGEAPGDGNPLFAFATFMGRLRQEHPALRQRTYGNGELDDADVSYLFFRPDGKGYPAPGDRCLRIYIDGSGIGDTDFVVLINMYSEPQEFTIFADAPWYRLIDTAPWAEEHHNCWQIDQADQVTESYQVHPWSIAVLQQRR